MPLKTTQNYVSLTFMKTVTIYIPAVDRLMGVLMALATEHYVLRDRYRALERQLAAAGKV